MNNLSVTCLTCTRVTNTWNKRRHLPNTTASLYVFECEHCNQRHVLHMYPNGYSVSK